MRLQVIGYTLYHSHDGNSFVDLQLENGDVEPLMYGRNDIDRFAALCTILLNIRIGVYYIIDQKTIVCADTIMHNT